MSLRPNLFVIGAMKSGTTSLHNYLENHADIYMSQVKEPGYFAAEINLDKGENWYLSLFAEATSERYIGESSTYYTKWPTHQGVPERIKEFTQSPRFIYLMRHPFERLVSHYWYSVRGVDKNMETRPIRKAIERNPEYLAFSYYAQQLRPYCELFGKESIYTLTLEALQADPGAELNRIFDWLDIARLDEIPSTDRVFNEKPAEIMGAAAGGLLNALRYSRPWGLIADLFPKSLREQVREMAYTQISPATQEKEIQLLKAELAPLFEKQTKELEQLLNKEFKGWAF